MCDIRENIKFFFSYKLILVSSAVNCWYSLSKCFNFELLQQIGIKMTITELIMNRELLCMDSDLIYIIMKRFLESVH